MNQIKKWQKLEEQKILAESQEQKDLLILEQKELEDHINFGTGYCSEEDMFWLANRTWTKV